jgi:hypothetical protein
MSKEKTVKLNEKQIERLKKAISTQKGFEQIKIMDRGQSEKKEAAIVEVYEYEKLDKLLD